MAEEEKAIDENLIKVSSLSSISYGELQSKAFRPFMTLLMNSFRNKLFIVIKENDELELSLSTIGTVPTLLNPFDEGTKEKLGSCRNNIRFALQAEKVYVKTNDGKFLSGSKAAKELMTFIVHHQQKKPLSISEKSLSAISPIVESYCMFFEESLKDGTSLQQFRLAIEATFRSDIKLWPPHAKSEGRLTDTLKRKYEEETIELERKKSKTTLVDDE